MSSLKFAKPLQVELSASFYYSLYIKLIHGSALMVLWMPSTVNFWLKIIFSMMIILSLFYSIKKTRKNYIGQLCLLSENKWHWVIDKNDFLELAFLSGSRILSKCIVLNFSDINNVKYSWCFFPDSIDDAVFRKLRIYLRYSMTETDSDLV